MIQYDRNMHPEDLVLYWRHGYVIARPDKDTPYSLATVHNATAESVTLVINDKPLILSRDAFFNDVILHRPHVNLVEKDNVVYRLAWTPPQRDAARALGNGSLLTTRLNPRAEFITKSIEGLLRWQSEYLTHPVKARINSELPSAYPRDKSDKISGLKLLVHAINNPVDEPAAVVVGSLMSGPPGIARLINSDEYVHRHADVNERKCTVYAGRSVLCTVRASAIARGTLLVEVPPSITKDSCWWRRAVDLKRQIESIDIGVRINE